MTDDRSEGESTKAVEKALGEPVFLGLSDTATKMRTHLLIAASIGLAVWFADLRIRDGSTFFGLQFGNVSDRLIREGLVCVVAYLALHFAWNAWDAFLEWRLRVTGTRLAFVTGGKFASENADYPDDPRQSTLHTWWLSQATMIGHVGVTLARARTAFDTVEKLPESVLDESSRLNLHNIMTTVSAAREPLERLSRQVEQMNKSLSSNRPPVSLARFDDWTRLCLRSQNLRWIALEFAFPLVLACVACCLLLSSLPPHAGEPAKVHADNAPAVASPAAPAGANRVPNAVPSPVKAK